MWGVGNSLGTCLYLDILYSMDRYKFDNIFASQINIKMMELERTTDYFHYEIVKIPSRLVFCDRLYYCLSLLFTFYSKMCFCYKDVLWRLLLCARECFCKIAANAALSSVALSHHVCYFSEH